jgi:hypothetical protein
VRSGWAMSQTDMTETYASLTIDTVRGIDLNFPDADLALSVDDFVKRYIEPNVKRLASEVDYVVGGYIKNNTSRLVSGGSGAQAAPTTIQPYLNARRKLNDQDVPQDGQIACIIGPGSEASLVGGLTPLQFNPQQALSDMFMSGQMSNAAGFKWYMSQGLTAHTCGTRTNTATAAAVTVHGQATLSVSSMGGNLTFTKGDVITVAGCYDVNPETKQILPYLKQFVVTDNFTASGSAITNLAIAPAIYFSSTDGYLQNCNSIAGNTFPGGALVSYQDNASYFGSGTASSTYQNDLVFHKKAFAFASAPLLIPGGVDMAGRASADGFSVRFVRMYDITNARMLNRLDIFFGVTKLRPEWACRVGASAGV